MCTKKKMKFFKYIFENLFVFLKDNISFIQLFSFNRGPTFVSIFLVLHSKNIYLLFYFYYLKAKLLRNFAQEPFFLVKTIYF